MPQFELKEVGSDRFSGFSRGRTPDEAVRSALDAGEDLDVGVAEEQSLDGWRRVYLDAAPAGHIRLHQRMRFRRD